jgi:subtilisin family serine protease
VCQVGQGWDRSNCSRKIIGARFYSAGASQEDLDADYLSPRDKNGHGTHVASTAAGSVAEGVSFHGLAAGAARGGAPSARIAVYKAAWVSGNGNAAGVLAAIDDAIHDGVDVLSLSLGLIIAEQYSFAALHAVQKGITVVFAGGNEGPRPQTLSNTAPWVITVAASTMDRSFPTVITLGNQRQITVHTENTNTSSEQLINSNPFVAECLTCPSIFLQGQSLYYHGKNSSRSPLRSLVFGGSYVELSSHLFSLLPCC